MGAMRGPSAGPKPCGGYSARKNGKNGDGSPVRLFLIFRCAHTAFCLGQRLDRFVILEPIGSPLRILNDFLRLFEILHCIDAHHFQRIPERNDRLRRVFFEKNPGDAGQVMLLFGVVVINF